jgi:thiol-disulfide isomerase/thioredoxin
MRLLFLSFLTAGAMLAGPNDCAPDSDARAALLTWRENLQKNTLAERRKLLDELAAKYPAAFEIQSQRISLYRWNLREAWPGVREFYVKRAEQNPGDPLALTLAATALHRTDTPRAIELLTKAREIPPGFPWAALRLAEIYQAGKFEDKDKARANFDAYASACAERLSRSADWVMSKVADTQMQAAIAKRLRARLDAESSPDPGDYEILWSLEFRSRPPAEHPELRKQVSKDVERLLASKPDKRFMGSLLAGVKQSGASKEAVTAFEDRVLTEAPESYSAYSIASDRMKKEHKEPEDHKDVAAWEAWKQANRAALKQWTAQLTEATWLEDSYMAALIEAGELKDKEAIAAVEKSMQKDLLRNGPTFWTYANAASRLLKKGWQPAKAYDWLEKAWPLAEREDRASLEDDTLTDERRKEITDEVGTRGYVASDYLRAMKLAGRKNLPASVRAYVEGPMPAKKADWTTRYRALAWLASVDGREADALAYFQQALFTREKAPQFFRGKLEDIQLDEAKMAFLKTGGTEKAFALWSKPSGKTQELAEGRWEKPKKTLPSFDLADISGKTWKLKQLEGKAVLINLWATWCGPCRSELPFLQKLYEKTRDRADIQVISFNVDEDLGLVEPYMKEQGFTFPALIAFGLIRGIFDGYGIPQNWLVDPRGDWIATQIGFDSADTDWANSMLKRLDSAKQGKAPARTE